MAEQIKPTMDGERLRKAFQELNEVQVEWHEQLKVNTCVVNDRVRLALAAAKSRVATRNGLSETSVEN